MKIFLTLIFSTLTILAVSPAMASVNIDGIIVNSNEAIVSNNVEAVVNTGENTADGSFAGNGGNGGAILNRNSEDSSGISGNGGDGGNSGEGGTVITGDATVITEINNTINSNRTSLKKRCYSDCCDGCGAINVDNIAVNLNSARLSNSVAAQANTGINTAIGSYGGAGGEGGMLITPAENEDQDVSTGQGGSGGCSSPGGLIQSGSAVTSTSIVNIANRNLTRIRH